MKLFAGKHKLWKVFGLVHMIAIILFIIYSLRTEAFVKVDLWSDQPYEVIAETPMGKKLCFSNACGDTLSLNLRPWKTVQVSIAGEKQALPLDFDDDNLTKHKLSFPAGDLHYKMQSPSRNSTIAIVEFLISILPVLQVYFLFLLFMLTLVIYRKTDRFKKWNWLKLRFFRYIANVKDDVSSMPPRPLSLRLYQKVMLIAGIIVLIPVFYLNLGKYPFAQKPEEKRRALVSLEMKMRGEYIAPTIQGEPYYKKPPLFNWLLIPFVDGDNPESACRSVSVSILLLGGLIIFFLLKKQRGWQHALFVVFMYLSSFYVTRYLSFILNIDVLFVLFLVPLIYLNYRYASSGRYYRLFIFGYALTGLAFLTKGIPALWIQFVSLMMALIINKKLKYLFSLPHLYGIFVLLLIIAGYFGLYSMQSNLLPYLKQFVAETLVVERFSFNEIVAHFISFPGLNMAAFMPLALFLPLVLLRENLHRILKSKKLSYLLVTTIAGVSVFWISPYYLPYYSLMFVPVMFDVLLVLFPDFTSGTWKKALRAYLFFVVLIIPGFIAGYINVWALLIFGLLVYGLWKYSITVFLISGLVLVIWKGVGDMGYYSDTENYILPTREKCKQIVNDNPDVTWKTYSRETKVNCVTLYYLTYFSEKIVPVSRGKSEKSVYYIIESEDLTEKHVVIDTIPQLFWTFDGDERLNGRSKYHPVFVVKFKQTGL
ncbi:MAG: ArnT family glycosyltransferase [Bacteroidota bacterium]